MIVEAKAKGERGDLSSKYLASGTKADSNLASSTGFLKASAVSGGPSYGTMGLRSNRPQTAKYNSREVLSSEGVDHEKGRHMKNQKSTNFAENSMGGRVYSAKELPLKVVGKKSLPSGRTQISNLITAGDNSANSMRKSADIPKGIAQAISKNSFQAVAVIDGESHQIRLDGNKRSKFNILNRKMQRSSSTRRSRPNKHDNMILNNTLNERIKALKAT